MLDVTQRRPRLTRRERQVLAGLGTGFSRKEVAARLGISYWTVATLLSNAKRRNGANTTYQLLDMTASLVRGRDRAAWSNRESAYRDELAQQLGGDVEVQLPFGRADVATETDVFEVEPIARWRRGLQQAVLYGVLSGLHANLALYIERPVTQEFAAAIWTDVRSVRVEVGLWVRRAGAWARVESQPERGWEPGPLPRLAMRDIAN